MSVFASMEKMLKPNMVFVDYNRVLHDIVLGVMRKGRSRSGKANKITERVIANVKSKRARKARNYAKRILFGALYGNPVYNSNQMRGANGIRS